MPTHSPSSSCCALSFCWLYGKALILAQLCPLRSRELAPPPLIFFFLPTPLTAQQHGHEGLASFYVASYHRALSFSSSDSQGPASRRAQYSSRLQMVAWGIVITLMGIVENFAGLFAARVFVRLPPPPLRALLN